jgi:hypothetical protein
MLDTFLGGMICMGCAVVSLYFLRFWKRTHDRLFVFFGLAFLVLMGERAIREAMELNNEFAPFVYSLRLIAFGLILIGIVDKNSRG